MEYIKQRIHWIKISVYLVQDVSTTLGHHQAGKQTGNKHTVAFRKEISMFYTSICTKVCSSSWMALGMKLVTVAMYKIFKIGTNWGKKYNKILSWGVKCLKHKDHRRFLEDGYKIVI
jgi:hypothetical protein